MNRLAHSQASQMKKNLCSLQDSGQPFAIANIGNDQVHGIRQTLQIFAPPVDKIVDHQYMKVLLGQLPDQFGSDKTGAASHDYLLFRAHRTPSL